MDPQKPNDPNKLIEFIAATVESMREQMATKQDLKQLRTEIKQELDSGLTAVRGDIERLAVRVDTLDRSVSLRSTAIQTEVSRIRSVVYLLVKDQPELVSLLG